MASGVPDMDAHGFIASEHGAAQAQLLKSLLYGGLETDAKATDVTVLSCIGGYTRVLSPNTRALTF